MISKHPEQHQQQSRPRKRTHLTSSQIAALQASFMNNQLPEAATRHALSLSLGISERTVQIWFQNRRAKHRKMLATLEVNGDKDEKSSPGGLMAPPATAPPVTQVQPPRYQATFRTMMTPELFEEMNAHSISSLPSSSTSTSSLPSTNTLRRRPRSASKPERPQKSTELLPRAMSEEMDRHHQHYQHHHQQQQDYSSPACMSTPSRTFTADQSAAVSLPVHLLRIGTWTRFDNITNATEWGLICYCSKDELVWQIQAEGQQFRIHIPLTAIHQLTFGTDNITGQLDIQLDPQQLIFTMCLQQHPHDWVRCGDFSEEKQASQLMIHELQGNHDMLQQAVLDIVTLVPDLAAKFVLLPATTSSLDDLCRDFTISPSATPEPSFLNATTNAATMYPNHLAMLDKSMMLQAPFYYPSPLDDQQYFHQMMML